MITKLSLENWKSHSHSEFSFSKGTNVLVGRMGSGKSSVLDALCFALYGTFPKMSRRDQTVEDLVNSASGASAAVVRLEFEKSGKKYSVMRKVGKKASEAEVHCEGRMAQKSPKAVTEYVVGILGVDYELFTRAIYSEQNKIDYLLSLNPRARKGEIDYLLGLGQFDTAREAAQAAYGKLSDQSLSYSQESDSVKMAGLKNRIAEEEGKSAEKKKQHAALKQQAAELSARVTHQAQEMLILEKIRENYQKKKSECERLEGALARLKKDAEGKKRPSEKEVEASGTQYMRQQELLVSGRQEASNQQSEHSSLNSEIAILENGRKLAENRATRAEDLERKIKALLSGKTIAELDAEAEGMKDAIDRLTSLHASLHAQIAELTSAVQTLEGAGAKCPVCDADLSEGKTGKIAGGKKETLGAKKAELGATGAKLKEKKAALSAYEKNASDCALCNAELARLKSEGINITQFRDEIAKKEEARKKKAETLKFAQQEVNGLEKELEKARTAYEEMQRAAKMFAELESSAGKFTLAQEELSKLDFSEDAYEEKRKAYEELRLASAKIEAEAAGGETQIRLMEELAASIRKELIYLQEKENLAGAYGAAAQGMAIYKNSLAAAQSELRANLIEEINQALCEIWPSVYPYVDYGGVKMEADEKDYRLLMEKNGAWREVDSIASGGERACLCLALRIAFATVLTPDIGLLILDEPTHNLDADAVLLLSEAINTKIPTIVEQTFVITHDNALGETSEGAVFRLERDKSKNESTRVEKAG